VQTQKKHLFIGSYERIWGLSVSHYTNVLFIIIFIIIIIIMRVEVPGRHTQGLPFPAFTTPWVCNG